jgi:hypothetical protein
MPTAPISLPETVSPGQLITADLINAMLEALRGYEGFDERLRSLALAVSALDRRIDSIEELIDDLNRKGNDMNGLIDRLRIDRDDILARLDDLNATVIPGFRRRFDDIETDIGRRFEPIERRVTEVELKLVRPSDPIERMPGLTAEHITRLHSHGIQTVSDLKLHSAELSGIIGNDIEALRISNMVDRVGFEGIG